MKNRQEEAAIERAPFADFSISDIIFGHHASRYIHWLLISSVPATSMREVSSERYKNFYPGSTSGIYQHRRGAADFLSDLLVYPISVELRRGIPLGWRLLALLDRDEIRAHEEVNYPFSEVFLFSKKSLRKNRSVFPTEYIMEGRFLSRHLTLFRLIQMQRMTMWRHYTLLRMVIQACGFNEHYQFENQ